MTVGQFSEMIPGLGHQLVQAHQPEELRVTVGFGFMFWTLAWHGLTPKQFQPFDDLESGERQITAGEGDLWIHYSSTDGGLISKLVQKVENNLGALVKVTQDLELFWEKPVEKDRKLTEDIMIPAEEPEFENGTFILELEVHHPPLHRKVLLPSLEDLLVQEGMAEEVLVREMTPYEEANKGTRLFLFHKNSRKGKRDRQKDRQTNEQA